MSKPQGLLRRGNVWYYRRRIPLDLVGAFGSQRELKESLHTTSSAEAKVRRNLVAAKFDAQFAEMRAKPNGGSTEPPRPNADLREAIQNYVTAEDAKYSRDFERSEWGSPEETKEALIESYELESYFRDADHPQTAQRICVTAREIFGDKVSTEQIFEAWELLRRANLELERRRIARLKQDFRPAFFDRLFERSQTAAANPSRSPTVQQVAQEYLADYTKTRTVGRKRNDEVAAALTLIQDFFGRDTPMPRIDRRRCREFRDLLHELPSNMRKHYPDCERPLTQIAADAARRKLPVLARDTQETYLSTLKQLLRWAQTEGHIERDPAADLVPLGEKVDAREARDPFSTDQLVRIFNAPLYRGCKDDKEGYALPGPNVIRGTRFWIPLVGLYTGMRLNEICQLDVADIQQSNAGTWCISVNASTPDKAVKNDPSKRSVPLHPDLIAMGFLDFLEHQRQKSNKLFPDLQRSGRGYHSERMSRWFNEGFLPRFNAKTEKTSFHSFRHNFRDALRTINAPPAVVQGLGGWKVEVGVSSRYGSGLAVDELMPWMTQVRFDGLDLTHLLGCPKPADRT